MKQIIIGVVLAILLVGCDEKPKFSLNEGDALETYTNNPVFTKIIPGTAQIAIGYKFIGVPSSVYGIETSDLDIPGGYIVFGDKLEKGESVISVMLKGKPSFDNLKSRIYKLSILKDYSCKDWGIERGNGFLCNDKMKNSIKGLSLIYDPITEISALIITISN